MCWILQQKKHREKLNKEYIKTKSNFEKQAPPFIMVTRQLLPT